MGKKIAIWVLPSLLAVLLTLLGYWVGRYSIINQFKVQFADYESTETLGKVLENPIIAQGLTQRQRTEYYTAYSEGFAITERVGDISWGVKNILTPFVGNAPWPGQHDNASIDRDQFRASHELLMPKPDKTYRVFITGGSTAYGSGAPTQESIIGVILERLLNEKLAATTRLNYEVFTYANPAWASTHERIAIENRLSELAPDKVISFSGNNDVFWAAAGKNILWFRTFADDFFWQLVNTTYQLADQPTMPDVVSASTEAVVVDVLTQRLLKNVRLAHHALQMSESQAEYVFALQPTLAVTKKPLTPRENDFINPQQAYFQQAYAAIDSAMTDLTLNNFRYLNVAVVFDQLRSEELFIDSFHFADKGNRLIAQALFEQLFLQQQ